MVSGLVTSPYDQERICSGEAMLIRIALKSLTSNIGLFLALEPGQVQSELGHDVACRILDELDLLLVLIEDLYGQAKGLQFLDQDLEGLRYAGLHDAFALDDRLVRLHPSDHVV